VRSETSLMHGSRSGCSRTSLHTTCAQPQVAYAPNGKGVKLQATSFTQKAGVESLGRVDELCVHPPRKSIRKPPIGNGILNKALKIVIFRVHAEAPGPPQMHRPRSILDPFRDQDGFARSRFE
jgi:hypothetical protein